MAALITYLNVEHSLPYGRLTQITGGRAWVCHFWKERWPTSSSTCSRKLGDHPRDQSPRLSHLPGQDQMKRELTLRGKSSGNGSGNRLWLPIMSWISGAAMRSSKSILPKPIRECSSMIAGVPGKQHSCLSPSTLSCASGTQSAICRGLKNARPLPIGFNDSCSNPNEPEMPSGKKGLRFPAGKLSSSSIRMRSPSYLRCH